MCHRAAAAANALSMVPEERAWLRDPAALADTQPAAPPYRQDSRAGATADDDDDGADARRGGDELMATAGGDAHEGGAAEVADDNEAVAERLRALFRSCSAALRPGLVRRCWSPWWAAARRWHLAGQRLGHQSDTCACRQPAVFCLESPTDRTHVCTGQQPVGASSACDASHLCRPQKVVLTAADLRREAAVAAARLRVARHAPGPTPAARHDSSPADLVHRLTQLGGLTWIRIFGSLLDAQPYAQVAHKPDSDTDSQAA